jgi:hypothetical protein
MNDWTKNDLSTQALPVVLFALEGRDWDKAGGN